MDELFGGMFDFNRDGSTDCIEAALGFQILQDMEDESSDDEQD